MMKKLFLLSKQDLSLSKAELIAVTGKKDYEISDNLMIMQTSFDDYDRLAYTKKVYDLLFISNKSSLIKDLSRYNFNSIYEKDFALRLFDCKDFDERYLASIIFNNLSDPQVNLDSATTNIHIIRSRSKYFVCKLITSITDDYDKRKAHNRPHNHPTSLHPRLAKCLINLTKAKANDKILDPFCGTGGILIEAGLLGLKPIGFDIDPLMLDKAEANLQYYKIKNYVLKKKDATKIKDSFDFIIADLPYGLNTSQKGLRTLYKNFLIRLRLILKKRAIIMFPNFINFKALIKKADLSICQEFSYYLHRSLTKKIILIDNNIKKKK